MEFVAEAAMVLMGFSVLLFIFAVSDMVFLALDKLYKLCKHIRRDKEKAPRTMQRSKAHRKNTSNKSVA